MKKPMRAKAKKTESFATGVGRGLRLAARSARKVAVFVAPTLTTDSTRAR